MKNTTLFFVFIFFFLNAKSAYRIEKIENDFCTTSVYEGEAKIYSTGNSGPYIIKNVIGSILGTIAIGQQHTTVSNLKWGTHTFIVENSNGCSVDLTIEILKVNCGDCPSNSDHNLVDYMYTNSSTISGISSSDLQKLTTYFTSGFTVNSDIPLGMICVRDQCLYSNTMGVGYIAYGNLIELNKRLKNTSHAITVELEDQWGNPKSGSYSAVNGRMMFNSLQSGTYTLSVLLNTGRGIKVISTTTIVVIQKNCGSGSSKLAVLPNGDNNLKNNEITSQSNSDIYAKMLKNKEDVVVDSLINNHVFLDAFPNPFYEELTIKVTSAMPINGKLVLLNSVGQEIKKLMNSAVSASATVTIDLANLANGTYQAALLIDNVKVASKRVVKIN